ncbi:uncharacterized protein LOC111005099 [Momordica charantia]|uniref:Uncharacterized protein LOC111005099 n=1 Tax=Momordica charantia TaxID=3673 RepID=A0A6J1BT45_MOMCH|nr:uncharacterized protein LOC111005099 [Momordica charantia]
MALTTTCCLKNLNPPTHTKNQSVSWTGTINEGSWRKRCVLGVAAAGVAMALQMAGESGAIEMDPITTQKTMKWSEERMCPQWRFNSLETIVPENLPRPFARRRWDPVRLPPTTAPQLRATPSATAPTGCFSL